mmetsp:Transcript_96213/g.258293  ORF Transcript_96213/g.258293 Transcript_96213/m.258293 type:complete len:224 (+) Transcript_96213:425-1096(+)
MIAAAVMPAAPYLQEALPGPGIQEATVSVTRIVFAFGGVQGVLDMAGDVEAAETVLPKVVMMSIAATGLMYTLVCYGALSMVGVEGLTKQSVSPLGMVLERVGFPIGTETALAMVSLVSVGNTCVGIFTFISRIALSLVAQFKYGAGVQPATVYALMVTGASVVGQFFDVFALAGRIGVMLLVTFVVVDYTFVVVVAQTTAERVIGVVALAASSTLVLVDQFA